MPAENPAMASSRSILKKYYVKTLKVFMLLAMIKSHEVLSGKFGYRVKSYL